MISEDHLRSRLLRYLTGRLTEGERASFEEQLLADQDFSDAVAVCEQELIDAYALGSAPGSTLESLGPADAASLQSWIEASPRRVQRVEMAQALLGKRAQTIHRQRRLAVILAAAASVLVVAGVTLDLARKPLEKDAKAGAAEMAAKTIPLPAGAARLPGNTAKPEVILLIAERTRGDAQITTYRIHRGAPVQLQVVLSGETARSGYTLKVASLDGKRRVLLEQKELQAQSVEGQLYLEATFPPGDLPPAAYGAFVSRGGETLVSHFAVTW